MDCILIPAVFASFFISVVDFVSIGRYPRCTGSISRQNYRNSRQVMAVFREGELKGFFFLRAALAPRPLLHEWRTPFESPKSEKKNFQEKLKKTNVGGFFIQGGLPSGAANPAGRDEHLEGIERYEKQKKKGLYIHSFIHIQHSLSRVLFCLCVCVGGGAL